MATTASDFRCSAFEKIEELSLELLAKNGIARFADKGEDSKVVARLIERLREAIVCYQVGDCSTPVSVPTIANGGTDITTASDILSNRSSHSNVFPIVSGTGAYRSVFQVIVQCALEASGGNPLQYGHHSTCSRLNRNPHRRGTSWNPSWHGWIDSGVTHGKSFSTSGGRSCSSKQRELTPLDEEANSLPATSVLSETRRKPSMNVSQLRDTWNEK